MKSKIFTLLLMTIMATSPIFAETVIVLHEVIEAGFIGGDGPLDNPDEEGDTPTRPNDFRASINGNSLAISKQNEAIPSAHATVVNAQTGSIVVNQQFTSSLLEQIATSGVYVLHIQTAGGALVGQFVVQ